MEQTVSEWVNLVVRWVHVFAGILWIGSTYYFTWLDRRLSEELGGVWMVHSGGFYVVQKQKPAVLPARLHWFRYEALTTWVSGLVLLAVVYYFGGLVIDPDVRALGSGTALALGAGLLVAGWLVYDGLWISPLARFELPLIAVCYLLLVGTSWALTRVLSARAAYIHVGALMGTIMAANVWLRILPAQRRMVAGLREGRPPDEALAASAKHRSKHNTFLVIPVVFTMISNHYPTATYGSDRAWLVLSVLILVGWAAAKVIRDH